MRTSASCLPMRARLPLHFGALQIGLVFALLTGNTHAIITFDDPNYYVPNPGQLTGTANLRITRLDGSVERCSGALVQPGDRVLTAAHCLAGVDGKTAKAASVEITFDAVSDAAITSTQFTWHESWTGNPKTSAADIGVVKLPVVPPSGARPFLMPDSAFDMPLFVLLAGYGEIGKGGVDSSLPSGYLHVGGNHYDEAPAGSSADFHLYDFDDYTETHNQLGEPGWVTYPGPPPVRSEPFFDFELDGKWVRTEGMIGYGDSGGPSIVDAVFVVGIHSWAKNDIGGDAFLLTDTPDGFVGAPGSIGGDVMVANYADWVRSAFSAAPIPEPQTQALLLAGLAVLAFTARRRISRHATFGSV